MTTQHGILAICTAAARTNLNLVFAAMGLGPDNISRRLTDDPTPTVSSEVTHYAMYNAAALATDAQTYDQAKLGFPPNETVEGFPIFWGQNGVISEPDAVAAFQSMQFWLNSSDMEPSVFAEEAIMPTLGLSYVPDET